MCSIIGSFSKERLKELAKLNEYRGQHSHSLYVFDDEMNVLYQHKGKGSLKVDEHVLPSTGYIVAHQQAPTYEDKNLDYIHPSEIEEISNSNYSYLWHNGIIKNKEIKRLQKVLETPISWDTKLIHNMFMKNYDLSDLDGTFACLCVLENKMYMFTNEICPLFINTDNGDVSSTKFDEGIRLNANIVYNVNCTSKDKKMYLNKVSSFKTKENPYFFI